MNNEADNFTLEGAVSLPLPLKISKTLKRVRRRNRKFFRVKKHEFVLTRKDLKQFKEALKEPNYAELQQFLQLLTTDEALQNLNHSSHKKAKKKKDKKERQSFEDTFDAEWDADLTAILNEQSLPDLFEDDEASIITDEAYTFPNSIKAKTHHFGEFETFVRSFNGTDEDFEEIITELKKEKLILNEIIPMQSSNSLSDSKNECVLKVFWDEDFYDNYSYKILKGTTEILKDISGNSGSIIGYHHFQQKDGYPLIFVRYALDAQKIMAELRGETNAS